MKSQIEKSKHRHRLWGVLIKVGLTCAFAFWFYVIWNSTANLNQDMNIVSAKYSAVHNVQVDFKSEVQEWKNVLLRSNNSGTLQANWQAYEAQYQKVVAETQRILAETDISGVRSSMNTFADAHAANHELYKKAMELLAQNGFNAHQADETVKGVDRPLVDYLEAADEAMQQESKNINERMVAKAKNQVDQSLLILSVIALLVIWMPKW